MRTSCRKFTKQIAIDTESYFRMSGAVGGMSVTTVTKSNGRMLEV